VTCFRLLIISGAFAAALGCKNVYHQVSPEVPPGSEPFRAANRIYIALPEDAYYKKETVPNSGRRTSLALQDAFQRQTKNVMLAKIPEPLPDAVAHARDLGYDYVAFPTIIKWEDHPTEWNAVRDKLELKIDIVSVETGAVIRSTHFEARSKIMTDGGDTPQDLLADPVDKFVRSLYRVTYTPSALQKGGVRP
jgi:hypothetical protein